MSIFRDASEWAGAALELAPGGEVLSVVITHRVLPMRLHLVAESGALFALVENTRSEKFPTLTECDELFLRLNFDELGPFYRPVKVDKHKRRVFEIEDHKWDWAKDFAKCTAGV